MKSLVIQMKATIVRKFQIQKKQQLQRILPWLSRFFMTEHSLLALERVWEKKLTNVFISFIHSIFFVFLVGVFIPQDKEMKFAGGISNIFDSRKNPFSPSQMLMHNQGSFTGLSSHPMQSSHTLRFFCRGFLAAGDARRSEFNLPHRPRTSWCGWSMEDGRPQRHSTLPKIQVQSNHRREVDVGIEWTKYSFCCFERTTGHGFMTLGTFMIDSRLPGDKHIETQSKYFTRGAGRSAGLTCAATTGQGDVVMGSRSGDIRLFSRKIWESDDKDWHIKQMEGVDLVKGDGGRGGNLRARTKFSSLFLLSLISF